MGPPSPSSAWWSVLLPAGAADHRERILDIVAERPGIHKSALCREVDLAWSTVSYHVRTLERQGMISSLPRGREVLLFDAAVPARLRGWLAALRDERSQRLLEHIGSDPGCCARDLTAVLGASQKVIRRHLTELDDAGLVRVYGGRPARYKLRQDVQDQLTFLGRR